MLYEINYCCPDCGGHLWHTMQNLSSDELCCACCGSVYTLDEMEPHFYEWEHRENNDRAELLNILASYLRMIRRSGRSYPGVVLDDLEKSLLYVLHKNGRAPENGWRAK